MLLEPEVLEPLLICSTVPWQRAAKVAQLNRALHAAVVGWRGGNTHIVIACYGQTGQKFVHRLVPDAAIRAITRDASQCTLLDLTGCQLSDCQMRQLATLPKLRALRLTCCAFGQVT